MSQRPSRFGAAMRLLAVGVALLAISGCRPAWRRLGLNHDRKVDGLDVAIATSCLGLDLAIVLACVASDIDRDGRIEQDDVDFVLSRAWVPEFPALASAEPTADAANVPATAWIRLEFAERWRTRAAGTLTGLPESS